MEKNKKPLIFVSNDDGYYARGLQKIIEVVSKYGEVIAVAPESARSGMSHAITIKEPLRLTKVREGEGVTLYKCNGTPVDCVKLGLDQVVPREPDIMVSGINHGSNASISVIYSGTMGAALEACLNGITSIGFSLLDHSAEPDFTATVDYVDRIFRYVLENDLPAYTTLNVNVPKTAPENIKGLKVCRQTHGTWKEKFEKRTDPHNHDYFWLTGAFNNFEPEAQDTDVWALENNYVAVVPLKADFTAYHAIEHVTKLNFDVSEES